MSTAFRRAEGWEDHARPAPTSDQRPRTRPTGRVKVRRPYSFALMAALAALALQQATAAAAPFENAVATPTAAARPVPWPNHVRSVPEVPAVTTTTTPPTTAPPTTAPPTTVQHLVATTPVSAPPKAPAAVQPSDYGCGPALAYLSAHAAPGFHFECPGYSLGHQAMTCINVSGVCSGEKLIVISVPCRAAYMNEASNSWSMQGLTNAPIDPYGYCH